MGFVDIPIVESADDVEQSLETGEMYLNSSDLELGQDLGYFGAQGVGLRFQMVGVPKDATITSATIEFQTDEVATQPTSLTIRGQAADDASPFGNAPNNLMSRPPTAATVNWMPPPWTMVGQKHQSPNLSTIVQEIVNRAGWASGQDMVFIIVGMGTRPAESFDADPNAAAVLHIDYIE